MKSLILPGIAFVSLTAVFTSPFLLRKPALAVAAGSPDAHGPVIVELFTSEGCSSCPPADDLLVRLDQAHLAGKAPVIVLEEHVDYWDDLGWRDPYSSSEWTERQHRYAYAFRHGSVYTPQMVLDGHVEFVGSREGQALHSIEELAAAQKTSVNVSLLNPADGKDRISVRTGKLTGTNPGDAAEVWLAITESGLHTAVRAGENAGEDLHHAAVVRNLRKIGVADAKNDVSFSGEAPLSLDKSWQRNNLRAVVFLQEKKSQQIIGAAELRLSQ